MSNRRKDYKRKRLTAAASAPSEPRTPPAKPVDGSPPGEPTEPSARPHGRVINVDVAKLSEALGLIATNAWRARSKMVDASGEPKDEMRRAFRHVEGIVDALKAFGVEILDITGKPFDSGMALKVVSFEPTAGLTKEEIKETIKPSVTMQGHLIQVGEIIVGTPLTAG